MKTKLLALLMISSLALTACAFDDDDNTPKSQGSLKENDKKDENKKDESKKDESKKDESKKDENKKDENKKDENKKDENKKDENKQDDPKPDTPYTMEQQVSAWKISISGDTAQFSNKQIRAGNDGDDFDNIVVNGKEMKLSQYENGNNPRVGRIDGADGTAYARYGLIISESAMGVLAFFQGQPTEINDMPTINGVKYVGQAFAFNPTKTTNVDIGGEVNGTSTFTVNFADKTMSGDLTNWKGSTNVVNPGNIHIEAKIKGNSFSTKDTTGTTANVKAEGKFYGPKAQNLAGAFSNNKTGVQGTLGANKQ